jgi:hypothetical protein
VIEPTGVDRCMDQHDETGSEVTPPLLRRCTTMRPAIVHDPAKPFAGTIRWFLASLLGLGVGVLVGLAVSRRGPPPAPELVLPPGIACVVAAPRAEAPQRPVVICRQDRAPGARGGVELLLPQTR